MTLLTKLFKRFHVDPAVGYALAMRFWQVPAGMVTVVLAALIFDDDTLGIYYTLLSLIGLQALADSGLLNVLMHATSHEWSRLRLDDHGFIRGPSKTRFRISAMVHFGFRWFFLVGFLFCALGSGLGLGIFYHQGVTSVGGGPLLVAMGLASFSLAISPLIAALEGFHQMETVNQFRLMQAVSGSIFVWAGLASGAGLWTPAISIAVQLTWEIVLVFGRYGNLFRQLRRTPHGPFQWRQEIWPLQWRIGLQSTLRYLAFFPLIPTLFAWQGPAVAGRVGITWSVLNNLLMMSYAWIRTRAPELGRLIASGNLKELARTFYVATIGSTLLLAFAMTSFLLALVALPLTSYEPAVEIAGRFLEPSVAIWFALAMIPLHLTQCFSIHLRAQKMDPIWRVTAVMNLSLAAAIFVTASRVGVEATAITMLIAFTSTMMMVGLIFKKYERMLTASAMLDRSKPTG